MIEKKVLFLLIFITSLVLNAQMKVYLSSKTYELHAVEVVVSDCVFTISAEGNLLNFSPLDLNGEVDYYNDSVFDKDSFGKIKKIGNLNVEYWDAFGKTDGNSGKIKSIGKLSIDYYDRFDPDFQGRVKSIGDLQVQYWEKDMMDNSRFGRMKSVGSVDFDYGKKDAFREHEFAKPVKIGGAVLHYWDDKILDKTKYGKLKSVKNASKDIRIILH